MSKRLKRTLAIILACMMVAGGLQVFASEVETVALTTTSLGDSSTISVTVKNVEGGCLAVSTDRYSTSDEKYVPIDIPTEITLEDGFIEFYVIPQRYYYNGLAKGKTIICTDIEVKTASGNIITPNSTLPVSGASQAGDGMIWADPDNAIYGGRYKISESVIITGKFEIVDLVHKVYETTSEDEYVVAYKAEDDLSNYYDIPLNKGGAINISTQLATFLDSAKNDDYVEMSGFTYRKANPSDSVWSLFDISSTGLLTSKAPITEPGYYYFDIVGTHLGGRETTYSMVSIIIGAKLFYHFNFTDGYALRMRDSTGNAYEYTDSTFSEMHSKAELELDKFYGLTATDTWLTKTGKQVANSDKIMLDGSISLYAQYKDAAGKFYSVPALKIGGGTISPPVTPGDPDPITPVNPTSPNTSSSSGGGRSSDTGGSRANIDRSSFAKSNVAEVGKKVAINEKTALAALDKALSTAGTSDVISVKFKNPDSITAAVAKAMTTKAGGKTVMIYADSLAANGTVDVRISLNAGDIKTALGLNASSQSQKARSIQALFLKHFKAVTTVITTNQEGKFDGATEYAVKIDASLNKEALVFYTYNSVTNKYQQFVPIKQWMDGSGYLHFVTTEAGNIVITDSVLKK